MDPFDVLVGEDITGWTRDEIVKVFLEYADGKVIFIRRVQVAAMYSTFLAGLYQEITKIVGPAAKGLILNAAKNGGLRAGKGIRRRYERERGELTRDKAFAIAKNMLTIWAEGFGWGKINAEMGDEIEIKIVDSFEADGYRRLKKEPAKQPMCWSIFGYIWGLFEGILNQKFYGEQTSCIAMGDDYCTLVFKPQ